MNPYRKSFGVWVPDKRLTDNRGFISPGTIGAVAGSRRRSVNLDPALPSVTGTCVWWLKGNTLTSGSIGTWTDSSASGVNAVQSGAGTLKPTVSTDPGGGQKAAYFDCL
jgi:hypothetical protein